MEDIQMKSRQFADKVRKAKRRHKWFSDDSEYLVFYASNTCDPGFLSLSPKKKHIQIDFIHESKLINKKFIPHYYLVMDYSKIISDNKRPKKRSDFKNSKTAHVLDMEQFNPPKFDNGKLIVKYNSDNKQCDMLLEPCDTDKEEKYNCPYKYINYDINYDNNNKDWQKKVTYWFFDKIKKSGKEWKGDKIENLIDNVEKDLFTDITKNRNYQSILNYYDDYHKKKLVVPPDVQDIFNEMKEYSDYWKNHNKSSARKSKGGKKQKNKKTMRKNRKKNKKKTIRKKM